MARGGRWAGPAARPAGAIQCVRNWPRRGRVRLRLVVLWGAVVAAPWGVRRLPRPQTGLPLSVRGRFIGRLAFRLAAAQSVCRVICRGDLAHHRPLWMGVARPVGGGARVGAVPPIQWPSAAHPVAECLHATRGGGEPCPPSPSGWVAFLHFAGCRRRAFLVRCVNAARPPIEGGRSARAQGKNVPGVCGLTRTHAPARTLCAGGDIPAAGSHFSLPKVIFPLPLPPPRWGGGHNVGSVVKRNNSAAL